MKAGVVMILCQGDRFLLGKRSMHKDDAPGYWCPPSGKIQPGESESQAVKREALEELAIEVTQHFKFCTSFTDDKRFLLHWHFIAKYTGEAKINNSEHDQLEWYQLDQIRFLEPHFKEDIEILAAFAKQYSRGFFTESSENKTSIEAEFPENLSEIDLAWLGDSILSLYLRKKILNRTIHSRASREDFKQFSSNHFLSAFGNPTSVEAKIGKTYLKSGIAGAFAQLDREMLPLIQRKISNR